MNKHLCSRLSIIIALLGGQFIQSATIDLKNYEKRLMSPYGQDGILEKIFNLLQTASGYYVEIQAGNGHFQSTTKYVRKKYRWSGLLFDESYDNPALNLHKELITPENVCQILEKYNAPQVFDLAIIHRTGNAFYMWQALSKCYTPKVVVIEFNPDFNYDEDAVRIYSPSMKDQAPDASMRALYNLGHSLGYCLIYQESTAHNLFFIRNDLITQKELTFRNTNSLSELYTGTPKAIEKSSYRSSSALLPITQAHS